MNLYVGTLHCNFTQYEFLAIFEFPARTTNKISLKFQYEKTFRTSLTRILLLFNCPKD